MRLPVKVLFAVSAAVSGYKERKNIDFFFSISKCLLSVFGIKV